MTSRIVVQDSRTIRGIIRSCSIAEKVRLHQQRIVVSSKYFLVQRKPIAVLWCPLTFAYRASLPTATLASPFVFEYNACTPTAELLFPLFP
jgi:hypothetical protein